MDTTHFLGRSWSKGSGTGRGAGKHRASARRWYDNNRQVYRDRNRARQVENAQRICAIKNVKMITSLAVLSDSA